MDVKAKYRIVPSAGWFRYKVQKWCLFFWHTVYATDWTDAAEKYIRDATNIKHYDEYGQAIK